MEVLRMRRVTAVIMTVLLGMSVQGVAIAAEISAKIVFSKRPAVAGVLYSPTVPAGKEAAPDVVVDQLNKNFTSVIQVGHPGSTIRFLNSDKFDHNIFASDSELGVQFDFGLMAPGVEQEQTAAWEPGTLLRIGCKIHPRMRTYIANIPPSRHVLLPFDRKEKEYSVQLEVAAGSGAGAVLLIAGYEPIRVKLLAGQPQVVELLRKGRSGGKVTLEYTK